MGTIIRRSGGYRAVIRRVGVGTKTKTFAKKALAERWVHEEEARLDARALAGGHKVGALLMRYVIEVLDERPYTTVANRRHLVRFAERFADDYIADCDAAWWITFAHSLGVKPISRLKYLDSVAGALRAVESMKWCRGIPWDEHKAAMVALKRLKLVGGGGKGRGRSRRISLDELAAIKAVCPRTRVPMADIIDIAIELGMRQAEICRLRWSDLDEQARMIWVRDRKHRTEKIGNDWLIPLLGSSYDIISRQPRTCELIFPCTPEAVCNSFRRLAVMAGITGLHFHDLRHEAISRLFERGYSIPEVALVSGHRDWGSLKIYTQIMPHDLHKGPAARRPIPAELLAQLQRSA